MVGCVKFTDEAHKDKHDIASQVKQTYHFVIGICFIKTVLFGKIGTFETMNQISFKETQNAKTGKWQESLVMHQS